jgi:hypothetical protein
VQSPEQQSALPAQAFPSVLQPPGVGIELHVPLHAPPQQSLAVAQPPLSWVHGFVEQRLFVQYPEQQSDAPLHGVARPRHTGGGRAPSHVPDGPQFEVQHCSFAVQATPCGTQHAG